MGVAPRTQRIASIAIGVAGLLLLALIAFLRNGSDTIDLPVRPDANPPPAAEVKPSDSTSIVESEASSKAGSESVAPFGGVVLFAGDRRPVPSASIEVLAAGYSFSQNLRADSEGRFTFDLPSEVATSESLVGLRFSCTSSGCEGRLYVPKDRFGERLVVELFAHGRVFGTVVSPDGRPEPSRAVAAEYALEYDDPKADPALRDPGRGDLAVAIARMYPEDLRRTTTDAQGRFALDGLRAGAWEIRFADKTVSFWMNMEPGQAREIRIVIPRPVYSIHGTLEDEQGRPVVGKRISIGHKSEIAAGSSIDGKPLTHQALTILHEGKVELSRTYTDDSGAFAFNDIPYETVYVVLHRDPTREITNPGPYRLKEGGNGPFALKVVDKLVISGRVVDAATGGEIDMSKGGGILVDLRRMNERQDPVKMIDTDEHGRFQFYVSGPGPYLMNVAHKAPQLVYRRERVESIVAPATDLVVPLARLESGER